MNEPSPRPVALVAGGTSGIGLATARLLEKDFAVVVTGRDPHTLAAARNELSEDAVVLRADARSLTDSDRVAAELSQRFGRVDLAFLNAGARHMVAMDAVDERTYDEQFDVNVKGQVFMLQEMLPLLSAGSSVVFNAGLGVFRSFPNSSVVSAAKGAVLSFMRTLAVELAPRGIRVNAVSPGAVETPALSKLGFDDDALTRWRASTAERVPLGRVGAADDVAQVVAFLASPAAAFITGADIAVDGGLRVA